MSAFVLQCGSQSYFATSDLGGILYEIVGIGLIQRKEHSLNFIIVHVSLYK